MSNYKKILLFMTPLTLLFIFLGCGSKKSTSSQAGLKVAEAYGVNNFDKVTAIKYTFNVLKGDKTVSRSWIWKPKSNEVSLVKQDGNTISYNRSNLKTQKKNILKIDGMFINDNYWFLFPFKLKWDAAIKVTDKGLKKSPISKTQSKRLVVRYPKEAGGYTPGDVYELFIGQNNQIVEWIYRKGGSKKPSRIATWEDHKSLGPITVSLNHYDAEKKFRVWFTDVAIQQSGSQDWIEAK